MKDAADVLNCPVMDIEEGKVPYRMFLRAVAYANAKSRVMPFIEDAVKNKAKAQFDASRRAQRPAPPPRPTKKEPIAKKVE